MSMTSQSVSTAFTSHLGCSLVFQRSISALHDCQTTFSFFFSVNDVKLQQYCLLTLQDTDASLESNQHSSQHHDWGCLKDKQATSRLTQPSCIKFTDVSDFTKYG